MVLDAASTAPRLLEAKRGTSLIRNSTPHTGTIRLSRRIPTEGSLGGAVSHERGIPAACKQPADRLLANVEEPSRVLKCKASEGGGYFVAALGREVLLSGIHKLLVEANSRCR